jgi:alkylhydroperoxidase/carboxymuconolactone decarboxylase family protein YurZ
MGKQVKRIVNLALAAIGLAMGIAVVVMIAINAEVTTDELVRLLAIGVASLGIFALSNIHKQE